jgi:pSer/pThr/pTyr-binding forkhead associated (FHA) protein
VTLEGDRAVLRGGQLVLAMNLARPTDRPAGFALAFVRNVFVGRGEERSSERDNTGKAMNLNIRVPDNFMSGAHFHLEHVGGTWVAEDAGSKNGTKLNGAPLKRANLEDGDILVSGKTVFLFRSDVPVFEDEPDLDLTGTKVEDAATTTLHTRFASELGRLSRIAPSQIPILVHGETGTGKELVARAIHAMTRRSGSFVAVNCGALPPTLISSELFGARKGAYSGASENRMGLVRSADGGTLFLDEIAELPLEAQAAFLRVLQESEVMPVGGDKPVPVDIKLVAATHRDLPALVEEGAFREDLYARVAGYEVHLPPLRERREDLGLLIGNILERKGLTSTKLTEEAAMLLFDYDWPRNVRELEHTLMSAAAVAGQEAIDVPHLPATIREPERTSSRPPSVSPSEPDFVALLKKHEGNVSQVARELGTSRSQVRRLAKRYDVDLDALRKS